MQPPSEQLVKRLKERLEFYIPSVLPERMKPKREKQILSVYSNVWDKQWDCRPPLLDLDNSHLLGDSEIVVPYMVEEYSRLYILLKDLINEFKTLSQFHELKHAVDESKTTLNVAQLSNALFNDLKTLIDDYDADFDIKEAMNMYKRLCKQD